MRPHHLRLTAFGPFAGTVEADLDALAAGGLFLLQGPTGAGKTTLLDAICFALFGTVPGERGIRRLRSDHAEPGTRCEVALEVTLAGRRLRVTRAPAHQRAKKRGTGTATDPGTLRVEELTGGAWRTWSTRPDEAGELLADLVGMSAEQFTQVVLLPQGAFARFLHAGAAERGALLERLFGTDRFAAVEDWLAERRTVLGERLGRGSQSLVSLAVRVGQEAGTEPPEHPDVAWFETALGDLDARRLLVEADAVAAAAAAESAERAHGEELAREQRQRRRAEARAALEVLQASDPAAAVSRRRLAAARWAAPLEPLLSRADRTVAAVTGSCADGVGDRVGDGSDPAALRHAADLVRARRSGLEALLPQADRLLGLDAQSTSAAETRLTAERAADELASERGQLPALVAAAIAARDEAAGAERTVPAATVRAAQLTDLTLDAARRRELDGLLAAAHTAETAARDAALAAGERRLAVREALVAGQAGRLATLLVDGEACAVCGSADHPAPAAPDAPLPGDAEVAAVDAAAETAQGARAEAAAVVAGLVAERRGLTARLVAAGWGDDVGLFAARAAATAELGALRERAAGLGAATEVAEALAARGTALGADLAAARERVQAARDAETLLRARVDADRAELAAALGGDADLPAALLAADAELAALDAAVTTAEETQRLTREAATAAAELTDALAAAGGEPGAAGVAALRAAVLGAPTIAELAEDLAAFDAQVAAARAVPELALPAEPAADPAATGALAAERGAERDRLAAAAAVARDRHARVVRLGPEVRAHAAALVPLQTAHAEAAALADLARGGNSLGMTLSSYVLAARLEQVATAASQRLLLMTDGRYSLRHTDLRADRRSRGGLGLVVGDGWTGSERDAGTLSGGEIFAASLALALGLADVVTAEAGGAPIDALFVDEGFGSLDEDSLEEVMDVLDGLRSGGRVVGVVSHVPDLRRRIPAQLQVRKTRAGSTLEQTVA